MMHLVAGKTGHGGLIIQSGVGQLPRSLLVDRRYKIANAALEVHGVAAQTIVHQQSLEIVIRIEEDLRVGCAVRT